MYNENSPFTDALKEDDIRISPSGKLHKIEYMINQILYMTEEAAKCNQRR